MNLLVVAPAWIGDTVLAQPLFQRLLDQHPHARLTALAAPWVAPILRRMPQVHTVIEHPFTHGKLDLYARWRFARQAPLQGFDCAYVLPNSLKSALIPWFAGIKKRIGFTGESRFGLINQRHHLDKQALPQMADRFAQLAQTPGSALKHPLPRSHLHSTPAQHIAALSALQLQASPTPVIFCPGAEYGPAKRWPAEHFITLGRDLAARGFPIWLLGSAKDHAAGEQIAQGIGSISRNLCGATTLEQAIDLLALARLVVCNDSGLMHVAAALQRPLVALYGSSSPGFTPPRSEQASVLRLGLSCSPCYQRSCPLGHLDCLQKLTPDQVLHACLPHLSS